MALIGSVEFDDFDDITIAYDGDNPTTVVLYKEGKVVKTVYLTYTGSDVTNIEIQKKDKIENLELSYTGSNVTQITKEIS